MLNLISLLMLTITNNTHIERNDNFEYTCISCHQDKTLFNPPKWN